ncbi:hypothetical protein FNW02_30560 [Komarekiella sp. 'clone 1']|uniref:Uncharacterized protein n=1 Tax=Komarekiella delphini-convector SJRDD-AB1 TaxID=2593771 RepID=A0AA40VUB8_9NOST|nr:hypothetical protein [Komarekiella delphini-convector]MBD6620022.1 hypothetical protein [Komarekiella delphini-convector SJRDD-AB1]
MTDTAIEDIYRRLNSLTEDVNTLKIQAGTIGTSQVAIAEILNLLITLSSEFREFRTTTNTRLANQTDVLNSHTIVLSNHTDDLNQLKTDVAEILRILRDRNGGSGL